MHKHKDIGSVVTEFDRLEGKRLPGGGDSAYERGGGARRKF